MTFTQTGRLRRACSPRKTVLMPPTANGATMVHVPMVAPTATDNEQPHAPHVSAPITTSA
jgi:hypothetical protein